MRTLRFLLRKEFLQIFRDRLMLRLIFVVPIVQLLVLSNAATFEVKRAEMYVVDRDHSAASRGLIQKLQATQRFVVVGSSASMALADDAVLHRRAGMILGIPAGFERDVVRSRVAHVQLVLNAEDGATAGITRAYAGRVITAYARELSAEIPVATAGRGGPAPTLEVRARGWYNPDRDYLDYMVPGILVQLVTVVGTLLTAMNIVREKEIGTLDQLSVTPLARGTFIAGKLIPLWTIALFELSLGLLLARFVFDVPMVGSVGLVFLCAAVYLVAALGLGLFISTLVDTQQQAMFITFFLVMIYLLMSGLFTPTRSMPEWAQWLAELNPVKHCIDIMRAVMLKGAGVRDVIQPLGALVLFGSLVLTLAVRQYGRRVA